MFFLFSCSCFPVLVPLFLGFPRFWFPPFLVSPVFGFLRFWFPPFWFPLFLVSPVFGFPCFWFPRFGFPSFLVSPVFGFPRFGSPIFGFPRFWFCFWALAFLPFLALALLFLVKSSEASFSVHNIIRCKFTNNYYIAQSFSLILPSSLNSSLFPLILPPSPYLSKRHLSEFKNAILASVAALDFVACQSKKAANIHNRR